MTELTARRKADRAAMAYQVAELAREYGLAVWHEPEQPGSRKTAVDVECPLGLKVTVSFDGSVHGTAPDVYVLSWHGVEDGTRLHWGMFNHVNPYHGHKATDTACGFPQLLRILRERFAVIRDGSAFITEGQASL
jgi:hypothetical protein